MEASSGEGLDAASGEAVAAHKLGKAKMARPANKLRDRNRGEQRQRRVARG
jgi:hypothetical protein